MPYRINTGLKGTNPTLQICDASSGAVRLAWEYPRQDPALSEEDRELLTLRREEAIHELFRRLFMLTTEQYLKGEISADGTVRSAFVRR
ncbi:hypothetical protein L861_07375 [Litchfieldella anticariensis FP35 = DSM 16096]|uniref:Uncharacterized protein n=1 Tax=Litchfieldella anticariensis (strain DSM 16096 / CECT 5854 / CIP 108499 / LMG 22089 / FP35) TaxID=1121939 RepID=S2KY39_LITA3|nr:hypothetical protein [Halomonas anticariensis]EPC00309.1 hypothetical protein L861_07375 [Halomonas anticariensis FP35 = DSM 16096]